MTSGSILTFHLFLIEFSVLIFKILGGHAYLMWFGSENNSCDFAIASDLSYDSRCYSSAKFSPPHVNPFFLISSVVMFWLISSAHIYFDQ